MSKVNISTEQGTTENNDAVHCKNLEEKTNHMLLEREYSVNHLIKLGIDGGGSFYIILMKMSLDETFSRKQKTLKLLTTSTVWDTGVKRQLIPPKEPHGHLQV